MARCDSCNRTCNSHFKNLRPSISEYKVSSHMAKNLDNPQEAIDKIMNCEDVCSSEIHKFEEKIGDLTIFRAKIDGIHIVYAVNKEKILFFLRAFRNFSHYGKFLEDKKEIRKMVELMS
jgi:hypothetical protein